MDRRRFLSETLVGTAGLGAVALVTPPGGPVLAEIRHAFGEYGVVFFRDQQLTPEQHLAFARCFGGIAELVVPIDPGGIAAAGGGAGYGRSLEGLAGKLESGEDGPGPPGSG